MSELKAASGLGPALEAPDQTDEQRPLVSVIIPTVGRESLAGAIRSALYHDVSGELIEVIVVQEASFSARPAREAVDDSRVTVAYSNRRSQVIAQNVGAAVARGQYLLFLDDDDELSEGALSALLATAGACPTAVVAYGGVCFRDKTGRVLARLNLGVSGNCASHMLAGAWIPTGSAVIKTEVFFEVGGFNPTYTATAEVDLFRRLAVRGDFANTPVTCLDVLRGEGWASCSDYSQAIHFHRLSRENVLHQRGVLVRLLKSARCAYWRGRNVQAYLASVLWNLRSGRLMAACSRACGAALCLLLSGPVVFQCPFWQAIRDSKVPQTGQRVLGELDET